LSLAPAWLLVSVPSSPAETASVPSASNYGEQPADTGADDIWLNASIPTVVTDTFAPIQRTPSQALVESPSAAVSPYAAADFPWLTALLHSTGWARSTYSAAGFWGTRPCGGCCGRRGRPRNLWPGSFRL
jgi:hypothetical protein